jgi:wobble nucleotide-excising tRNase
MMIRKIKTINNMAVFDRFDWDGCVRDATGQPLSFKKINILYGRNYSGKTTLSRILRTLETHQLPRRCENLQFEVILGDGSRVTQTMIDSTPTCVRVFNEDFVRENLQFLIDPDGEIAPFAILGADNAELEKAIKDLETEIGSDNEGQETGLYKQLKNDIAIKQKITTAYTSAKENLEKRLSDKAIDRKNGIKYNFDRFGDQNYTIAKLKKDIGIVMAKGYIDLTAEKKAEHEDMIKEQSKPEISLLSTPNLRIRYFLKTAAELLSREIGTSKKIIELLHDAVLNEWVKNGKALLEGNDICAFCGNPISKERWENINDHFDEESKNLEAEIDVLLSEINADKEQLLSADNIDKNAFYSRYFQTVGSFIEARSNAAKDYCSSLDSIVDQLQARKAQITIIFQLSEPPDNSEDVKRLYEGLNKTVKENNEFSSKLAKAKTASQKALRLQEVADFCSTIGYASEMEGIDTLEQERDVAIEAVKNTETLLKVKMHEMQAKQRQLSDEEEGAKQINKCLNDHFGHNSLTLEAEEITEDEKRIRFRIVRDGKPAYNLSQGECSLISFCYFIAKLDDIDTRERKPIIWIDDPVSSLDSNHTYFVYTLIASRITNRDHYAQLFVSTHNLDFLKYLSRLGKKNMNFFIEREGKLSKIKKMPEYLSRNATEFNYLFSIIYKCSKCESVTDENFDMLHGFGNNARKFLELFLYFKYPVNEGGLLPKLKQFFGSEDVPPILLDRMLNEDSHGPSPEGGFRLDIDPQTVPVAKKIIEKLREDKVQYNALLKSIGAPET